MLKTIFYLILKAGARGAGLDSRFRNVNHA